MDEVGIGQANEFPQPRDDAPRLSTVAKEPIFDGMDGEPRAVGHPPSNLTRGHDVDVFSESSDGIPQREVPIRIVEDDKGSHLAKFLGEPLGILGESTGVGPEEAEHRSPENPEVKSRSGRFEIKEVVLGRFPDESSASGADLPWSGDPGPDKSAVANEIGVVGR